VLKAPIDVAVAFEMTLHRRAVVLGLRALARLDELDVDESGLHAIQGAIPPTPLPGGLQASTGVRLAHRVVREPAPPSGLMGLRGIRRSTKEVVMKLRLPSPAMVVAVIALIVALSGTAIAAVDFAQNAGAVDGKSAVGASASLRDAAGRLVATASGGEGKGQIPARFIDGVMRGGTMSLSKYLHTVDNQLGRPTPLLIVPGIGRFDARCDDADPAVGTQATRTSILFTASAPDGVNVSRLLGRDVGTGQRPDVFSSPKGQVVTMLGSADGLFQFIMESKGRSVLVTGAARTDNGPGPKAACLIWGTAFRVG
jgi:hypothetical protein